MFKLNIVYLDVKEYLFEVGCYWVWEFNIDGWCFDVVNEVDYNFWREFWIEIKILNFEVYILGEIWYDVFLWL